MKTIVCMKQVPSSNEVRLHPVTKTIIRDGKASVINPFDSSALEQAVQIKEKLGGSITALSMGILETAELLRDGMSRGGDFAMLLSDRAFAGADTLATSYTLSLGVEKIGDFDLIICGKMAVDGDTAQIGPELAQTLGIVYATDVIEVLDVTKENITVRRGIDGGTQVMELAFPALITVVKEIAQPRLPSIKSIKESLGKTVAIHTAEELGADLNRTGLTGSPTEVVQTFIPENNIDCVEIGGSLLDICKSIETIIGEVH